MAHFKNHRPDQPLSEGWKPAEIPIPEQNDPVTKAIFAPRSESNSRPCSDLQMLTDPAVNPQYANIVQNRLQKPLTPLHKAPLSEEGADIALDTTQRNFESDTEFAERMKGDIIKHSKKSKKSE